MKKIGAKPPSTKCNMCPNCTKFFILHKKIFSNKYVGRCEQCGTIYEDEWHEVTT